MEIEVYLQSTSTELRYIINLPQFAFELTCITVVQ